MAALDLTWNCWIIFYFAINTLQISGNVTLHQKWCFFTPASISVFQFTCDFFTLLLVTTELPSIFGVKKHDFFFYPVFIHICKTCIMCDWKSCCLFIFFPLRDIPFLNFHVSKMGEFWLFEINLSNNS